MKTITTTLSGLLFLIMAFCLLQSVKEMDPCESAFISQIDSANKEYEADMSRCEKVRLSHLCMTEANLYYDKQITQAYNAFNECYNAGKE